MATHFISKSEAVQILNSYKSGKIFTVTFIKRGDGKTRVMNCRKGVSKGVSGQGMKYDPQTRGLIPVYDMQIAATLKRQGITEAKAFRMISVEGVTEIKLRGNTYVVK